MMKIRSKKFRYGSASLALTALVIIAILLINVVVSMLTDRYTLKFDMTTDKMYEITAHSAEVVKDLSRPAVIHVLMDEAVFSKVDPYSRVYEILKRYVAASGGEITLEYVNVFRNPTFLSRYNASSDLQEGSLVVESGDRFRIIEMINMFVFDPNTYEITGLDAEQELTSALSYVTSTELQKAVILSGHEEDRVDGAMSILEAQNYEPVELNLVSSGGLPDDTKLLILNNPKADFTAGELNEIDAYLRDGGKMIVYGGINMPYLPELYLFFSEWGIEYQPQLVIDPSRIVNNEYPGLVPYMAEHEMNEPLYGSNKALIASYNRRIATLWDKNENITVSTLLQTSDNAYTKAYDSGGITTYEKEAGDRTGSQSIAVYSQIDIGDNRTGGILFFATPLLASDGFLSSTNMLNAEYFTQVANYLTGSSGSLYIPSKMLTAEKLIIMGSLGPVSYSLIIFWVLVIIFPVTLLAVGFVKWRGRRNR